MSNSRSFDILIDFDDVLYAWSNRAHAVCEKAGITNGKTIDRWHFWESYGCTEEEVWSALRSATISGWLYDGPLIPGALGQLRRLRYMGHRIHIVTARGFGEHGELIESMTREQIRNWNVPLDSLTFAKDKTQVSVDFALDDGTHNYEALDQAGVLVYLMDQPHNRAYAPQKPVRRVSTVKEFVDRVTAISTAYNFAA